MRLFSLIGGLLLVTPLFAQAEQLQVPQCLATKLTQDYPVLAENAAFKILDLPSKDIDKLVLLADQVGCGRFINVSRRVATNFKSQTARDLLLTSTRKTRRKIAKHYSIKQEEVVKAALAQIDSEAIWQTVVHLSNYYNRSATEKTGLQTAEWLKTQFENWVVAYGREDTSAYFVETGGGYQQPSLVTVIGKNHKAPAIVIGAHMDTLSGLMPGAGDDASGSATILEMARILLATDNHFKRPIYIIWYAAEERGLVGSQKVVSDFFEKAISVDAAIQFDMTGYRHDENDPTMWVFRDEDSTDKALSEFVAKLIKTYIKVPVAYSKCGYACSDHASWMAQGIPAAFPVETSFAEHNPYIHTSADTMSLLNTDHMTNFTKLALAFAIELASVEI